MEDCVHHLLVSSLGWHPKVLQLRKLNYNKNIVLEFKRWKLKLEMWSEPLWLLVVASQHALFLRFSFLWPLASSHSRLPSRSGFIWSFLHTHLCPDLSPPLKTQVSLKQGPLQRSCLNWSVSPEDLYSDQAILTPTGSEYFNLAFMRHNQPIALW